MVEARGQSLVERRRPREKRRRQRGQRGHLPFNRSRLRGVLSAPGRDSHDEPFTWPLRCSVFFP